MNMIFRRESVENFLTKMPSCVCQSILEPDAPIGLFEFARLRRRLSELVGREVDLVTRDAIRPEMRDEILREAVHAA